MRKSVAKEREDSPVSPEERQVVAAEETEVHEASVCRAESPRAKEIPWWADELARAATGRRTRREAASIFGRGEGVDVRKEGRECGK